MLNYRQHPRGRSEINKGSSIPTEEGNHDPQQDGVADGICQHGCAAKHQKNPYQCTGYCRYDCHQLDFKLEDTHGVSPSVAVAQVWDVFCAIFSASDTP
jgi:hypothetical protein